MMGIRFFVDPEEVERRTFTISGLDIDTGDVISEEHWVDLRAALSDREWSDLETGIVNRMSGDGEIVLDFAGLSTKQLLMWVKAWSLYNNGNSNARVKPTADMVGRLDRDVAGQIRDIIQEHIADKQAQREAMRNPTKSKPALKVVGGGDSETNPTTSDHPKPRRRGAN